MQERHKALSAQSEVEVARSHSWNPGVLAEISLQAARLARSLMTLGVAHIIATGAWSQRRLWGVFPAFSDLGWRTLEESCELVCLGQSIF